MIEFSLKDFYAIQMVLCAFSDGNLRLRMPLDPMHVHFK
jgi:hypothetical protein